MPKYNNIRDVIDANDATVLEDLVNRRIERFQKKFVGNPEELLTALQTLESNLREYCSCPELFVNTFAALDAAITAVKVPEETVIVPEETVIVRRANPELEEIGRAIKIVAEQKRKNKLPLGNGHAVKIPEGKLQRYRPMSLLDKNVRACFGLPPSDVPVVESSPEASDVLDDKAHEQANELIDLLVMDFNRRLRA